MARTIASGAARRGSIDTSTPEGHALLRWLYPERYGKCTRTDAHALRDCTDYATPVASVGAYVEIEQRSKRGTERSVVLITSLEDRGEYAYVGWRNAQPGGGWDRRLGQWGYFRQYPAEREYGTSIIRVVQ